MRFVVGLVWFGLHVRFFSSLYLLLSSRFQFSYPDCYAVNHKTQAVNPVVGSWKQSTRKKKKKKKKKKKEEEEEEEEKEKKEDEERGGGKQTKTSQQVNVSASACP